MIRAGRLRHLVTIQQKTVSTDSYGGPSNTWADFATCWADIEPLAGRELEAAQALFAEGQYRITMRYLAGVTTAMRILHDGKYFNLGNINDPEIRNRKLVIIASEGLTDG